MFQPLFTTKPVREGSGFGLPFVHRCVRQSVGAMRVDSELGTGTKSKLRWANPRRECKVANALDWLQHGRNTPYIDPTVSLSIR